MENIVSLQEYINDEIYDNEDKLLIEYLTEEFIEEIYSSEFFDPNYVNEALKIYDGEIFNEYRKIRKHLREGKQYKRVTARYFELETEYMRKALEADKEFIKRSTSLLAEKLNSLNEKSKDFNLNEKRIFKIKKLDTYQRSMIRKINKEIKEMEIFYANNPKILVV